MTLARATVAAGFLLAGAACPTYADPIRHCVGDDFHYLTLHATYVESGSGKAVVKQLDVDLEADKRSSYKTGQKVTFYVDGTKVGAVSFRKDINGDFDADLKLRSTSGKSIPPVKKGTKVHAEIRDVNVVECKFP